MTKPGMGDPVQLDRQQIVLAAGVLAKAFRDDPLWAQFLPRERERTETLRHLFRIFVYQGITYGRVSATSPTLEGVAVWLPSEHAELSPGRMMRSGGLAAMLRMRVVGMARAMLRSQS